MFQKFSWVMIAREAIMLSAGINNVCGPKKYIKCKDRAVQSNQKTIGTDSMRHFDYKSLIWKISACYFETVNSPFDFSLDFIPLSQILILKFTVLWVFCQHNRRLIFQVSVLESKRRARGPSHSLLIRLHTDSNRLVVPYLSMRILQIPSYGWI